MKVDCCQLRIYSKSKWTQGQCDLCIRMAKTHLLTLELQRITSSLHSFIFLSGRIVPSTPLLLFSPLLFIYIFIYYCWHEHWSPFKWSLDNDLPWGSVEQSSEEGKANFSSSISDWKLLWIYYCTNCTDLLKHGWCEDITNTPLEVQMKVYVICKVI